jgi:hypothetical protein
MELNKQTHDEKIFAAMVEVLESSALRREGQFWWFDRHSNRQTGYEEVARALNSEKHTNRADKPLTANALRQVVHRMKKKQELLSIYKPNWNDFKPHPIWGYAKSNEPEPKTSEPVKEGCLVCGDAVPVKGKKICSADCVKVYEAHKDVPHDYLHPTIFHQVKYEEAHLKK